MGDVLNRGLMIRSYQGERRLTNRFSGNTKTVNLNNFPIMEGYKTKLRFAVTGDLQVDIVKMQGLTSG